MFIAPEQYPFLSPFRQHLDDIRGEFLAYLRADSKRDVGQSGFCTQAALWAYEAGAHPEMIGFVPVKGEWDPVSIVRKGRFFEKFERDGEFSVLRQLCRGVPNLNFAGFFRLTAGSEVLPHAHKVSNIVMHMNLFDLHGDCVMGCGSDRTVIRAAGDWICFNYKNEHWTKNLSPTTRVNLVVDFCDSPHSSAVGVCSTL